MIKAYVNYMKSEKMSENTMRGYTNHINQMLKMVNKPESDITYLDLVNWKAEISNQASATVANKVAAVKSYFGFLANAKIINDDPSQNLSRPTNIKNKEKPYVSEEDARLLVKFARTPRDKAMFKFLLSTGVRFCEMANITIDQYNQAMQSDRTIELAVTKRNKGGKIYINDSTAEAIKMYLRVRDDECPYLFASERAHKLSDNSVSHTIKVTARRAGLSYWNDLSCHGLRTACATIMNDKNVPVGTISKVLRHSSLSVTTRYIKSSQNNINNATALMDF